MQSTYSHALTFSLVTLFTAGCSLGSIEVGGGFRDGEEEGSDADVSSGDEGTGDASSSGTISSSGDQPVEEPLPEEPLPEEPLPEEPLPEEPPIDAEGPLHVAFTDCAFNLVWTKSPHYNQGRGLGADTVAAKEGATLAFEPDDLNSWVFPGIVGPAALKLELVEIDAVTGEYVLGGQVVSENEVMKLPTLRIDPANPIVLIDATVQDPAGVGLATLTSLVDDSQTVIPFQWGLVVDLNGGANPACEPLLESVYGPF